MDGFPPRLKSSLIYLLGGHLYIKETRPQNTTHEACSWSGVGVHTGLSITVRLSPAPTGHGIQFVRTDRPQTSIPAHWSSVTNASLNNTTLGRDDVTISTVEHLLSALSALKIDNCLIEVDGPEMPILDGSSLPYLQELQRIGIREQEATRPVFGIHEPIVWSDGKSHLVALPSDHAQFTYTLHYPGHPLLHAQVHHFSLAQHSYEEEIAPCRTFALAEEIEYLKSKGLIRGGSLSSAVVIHGTEILNPEGLRKPFEMARHKILDLIGDLALIGEPIIAHVISFRSGHASNVALARRIGESLHSQRAVL